MVLVVIVAQGSSGQIRPRIKEPRTNSLLDKHQGGEPKQAADVKALFEAVERGVVGGNIAAFAGHFGKQVSLNVSGSESGFVSASQAVSILQNYFSSRKPTQFTFTRWNDSSASPYATGRMTFTHRGSKQFAQVYVSLAPQDGGWIISQFNIY
ncbi:MAG: DUF4783 domain-containing protein [Ignavibacteriales bacterium]|nr:DUF4783 domain-containing protein [Ignavibacteriales bacterium]